MGTASDVYQWISTMIGDVLLVFLCVWMFVTNRRLDRLERQQSGRGEGF